MTYLHMPNWLIRLCLLAFVASCSTLSQGENTEHKVLRVGEELWKETLPLQMGSRFYELQGLKSHNWYEVKISYPASIPASFSLELKKGISDLGLHKIRRLLNTEKLIFKTESLDLINDQGGLYVLVIVEPEGIVAIPHVQERETIIFNIVCDELLLGIPHQAWWVVVLVVICFAVALVVPFFLPSYLLPKNQSSKPSAPSISKES